MRKIEDLRPTTAMYIIKIQLIKIATDNSFISLMSLSEKIKVYLRRLQGNALKLLK
jgi:hypothetical protein